MARIAIVAGPDPGHLLPAAALAVSLHRRGHAVRVVSGGPYLDDLAADGPEVALLPMLGPTALDDDWAHIFWRRAGEMAPPLVDQLRPWRPDLVVTDVITTVGHLAGDLLGVPVVSLCPHHLMDPDPALPPVGLGRRPARGPLRRFDDAIIRRRQRQSLAAGRHVRDQVRVGVGLPPGHRPVARLLCTLPSLEPPRRHWPASTFVVGPLEWEPAWPVLEPPAGDDPLVVVTDSTATLVASSLGDIALEALAGLPIRLVLTRGDGHRRDDRVVIGRGSHAALLDHATLAVGPGGGGFLGKTMARGVPLIAVPGAGDQRESARRVELAGAGRSVVPGPRLAARLRRAVEEALADRRMHDAAARLAAEAARLGPDRAAVIVERYLPADAQHPAAADAS